MPSKFPGIGIQNVKLNFYRHKPTAIQKELYIRHYGKIWYFLARIFHRTQMSVATQWSNLSMVNRKYWFFDVPLIEVRFTRKEL